ncbi:response regulator [Thermocoleostomius sinensis]|jgi:DNA-binding NarL/FixJ family response regulator|uniref:Response regulator transcription factor n=1 Tax=Thermocoleostomius sinensis A174 TaxID=2016057 RepID=A0A9E9CBY9_9CYAN|nr:response regulator transcription factor [Thermocoleostomius sinensis]WAL61520.1 response regulator transcription factor [Thermocoleostomius sinensis A174]
MSSSIPISDGSRHSNLPSLRILLVEDDPVMQMGLEHFLSGYSALQVIGQAADGYSAIDAAHALQPDLIIMDIGLPQLDGIAATLQIKMAQPQVRILMLTSHKTERETIAALSSGADAYCIKGSDPETLLMAISCIHDGGSYLDPQIARRVLNHLKPPVSNPAPTNLSNRELEVLKLIVDGCTNSEIAAVLYLSPSTVKAHIRSIMNKLAVDDRVQAAVVALRAGLVH